MMNDRTEPAAAGRRNLPGLSASCGGFTLLELLISLTLLAVIAVIMIGAMRIGSRSVEAGEKRMEEQERFRTVLSLIDAQVQSQAPLTYEEEGNRKYYFRGEGKSLRFATNYSIWGGQRGYVVVDYRVEGGDLGKYILYASEETPGIDGRRDAKLIEAKEISFDYFYKDPTKEKGEWLETLSEGNVIPEKIRLHLARGRETLSLEFPVRVHPGMAPVQGGGNQ
jgi:general secretion pathway protein J